MEAYMLENTKGMKKIKTSEKSDRTSVNLKKLIKELVNIDIKEIIICFIGVFVSRSSIIGEMFPCSISFLCSYYYVSLYHYTSKSFRARRPSFIVLFLTLFSIATVKLEIKYILICIFIYIYYISVRKKRRTVLLFDVFGFAMILFTVNLVTMMSSGFNLSFLLINIFETLFIISSTFIIKEVIVAIRKNSFNAESTACLLSIIFISVLGIKEVQLLDFNVLMFLIFFSIIFVSSYISPFIGMVVGIAFGFFNYATLNTSSYYMLALGIGGVSCGLLKNKYKPLSGIMFGIVSSLILIYFKDISLYSQNIAELGLALITYTIVSFSFNEKLNNLISGGNFYEKKANEAIFKLTKLSSAINELSAAYKRSLADNKKSNFNKNKTVVSQLEETSEIINDTIAEMTYLDIKSKQAREKIEAIASDEKIIIKSLDIGDVNNSLAIVVTLSTERNLRDASNIISCAIRKTSGLNMKCTEKIVETGKFFILRFNVLRKISAKAYYSKLTKENSEISGDNYSYGLSNNKFYAILCDGMGTGIRAFNESKNAINLMIKLLDANFNEQQMISTLNSLLLLNLEDDRYVALDFSIIDYDAHELRMYKAGAAQSYLISEGEVKKLQSSSLPVGILESFDCYHSSIDIKQDDLIIMITDGIADSIANDEQKSLDKYLDIIKNKDPQSIADSVLTYAIRGCDNVMDDMTVLVIKIV
jgi:serine/threonine protein phosphatase PrpC